MFLTIDPSITYSNVGTDHILGKHSDNYSWACAGMNQENTRTMQSSVHLTVYIFNIVGIMLLVTSNSFTKKHTGLSIARKENDPHPRSESEQFCVVSFLTTQPPGDCEGVLILRATERPTLDARTIGHPPQGSCRWFPPINGSTYPEDLVKVDTGRPTVET